MRRSPFSFASVGSLSPLLWVTRGYAVLDGEWGPLCCHSCASGAAAGAVDAATWHPFTSGPTFPIVAEAQPAEHQGPGAVQVGLGPGVRVQAPSGRTEAWAMCETRGSGGGLAAAAPRLAAQDGAPAPEPNDTFFEQLTDSARAAVQEVRRASGVAATGPKMLGMKVWRVPTSRLLPRWCGGAWRTRPA